tara:strand:+ start:201 stop:470 length:270 start_codon:yes stop_codon:yes gene_type:complete
MTIELVLFISIVGILFNMISLWAITRLRNDQLEVIQRVWNRINYLEVGMSYHGMIPMPWEVDDIEDMVDEIKTFKQEGNVVYLQQEGKE